MSTERGSSERLIPQLLAALLSGALAATAIRAQDSIVRLPRPAQQSAAATEKGSSNRPRAPRLLGVFGPDGPLDGVEVKDLLTGSFAVTTRTGTVSIDFLTFKGAATFVSLRKPGFAPKQIVVKNDSAAITEVLEPAPLGDTVRKAFLLPGMEVNAAEQLDLEWKRRTSGGQYIPPGVLKDTIYQSKTIAEAIGMNGIELSSAAIRQRGRPCGMQVLLNGGVSSPLDLGTPAQVFTAVEFYPTAASTPEQYRRKDGASCGTLVLWTLNHP